MQIRFLVPRITCVELTLKDGVKFCEPNVKLYLTDINVW